MTEQENYMAQALALAREAAAAGALHIQLGGTHDYFGKPMAKPTIGDADRPAERADIARAVRLMLAASLLTMAVICAAALML